MKFCSNCGTQLGDEVKFCHGCGAKQPEAVNQQNVNNTQNVPQYSFGNSNAPEGAPQYSNPYGAQYSQPYGAQQSAPASNNFGAEIKKKTNGKVWLIPVAAVAAVALIFLVVFFFRSVVGSGSLTMKGAVKSFYQANEDMSGKKLVNATMSNSMLKALKEDGTTKKELIDEIDEMYEYRADYAGDDYEIRYRKIKITDKEKYDRDEVKDFVEYIEDETDVKVSIQKMYEVEVSYEVWDYYDEEWEEDEDTLILYKSAGNWYVFLTSLY